MTTGAESGSATLESERAADETGKETTTGASTPAVSQTAAQAETSREAIASKSPEPGGPSSSSQASSLPRYGLAAVCAAHAVVFVASAIVLPWRTSYAFSLPLFLLAALHLAVCVLALAKRHGVLLRVWTALAAASLVGLSVLSFSLLTAALYVAELYQGLGAGVAGGLFAFWLLAVLFTLPVSWWGLALAKPVLRARRAARTAGVALAIVLVLSTYLVSRVAHAEPVASGDPALSSRLLAVAEKRLSRVKDDTSDTSGDKSTDKDKRARKVARPAAKKVVECGKPLDGAALTLFVTTPSRRGKTLGCLQASDEAGLARALEGFLRDGDTPRSARLDFVSGIRRLSSVEAVLDSLKLRPGLDGVCAEGRCLTSWQLVALSAFRALRPLPSVRDIAFGVDFASLRDMLDVGEDAQLTRLETRSFLVDSEGSRALGAEDGPLVPGREELENALEDVERHVARAQLDGGGFRYTLDPFSGEVDETSTNLPRQAGTTLALCELGKRDDVSKRAEKALDYLSSFERKLGDKSVFSIERDVGRLGHTALPLVALLSCRGVVHKSYDQTITRAGRALLALQRPDGGFYPELDLKTGTPRGKHQPLFAAGQAVMALSLLEAWAPAHDKPVYREATERAMQYYAGPYWHSAPYDFFFLEENWHCLAARAALPTHRNDAYERFCLDYVTAKERLVEGEGDGPRALTGSYGVSSLFPPHNTATAGYGEALSAAIAVRRARHMPVKHQLDVLGRVLGFLTRNQWSAESCYACARRADTVGGFSESSTSPIMRIDYAQHAWAALGHGARQLAQSEASD